MCPAVIVFWLLGCSAADMAGEWPDPQDSWCVAVRRDALRMVVSSLFVCQGVAYRDRS